MITNSKLLRSIDWPLTESAPSKSCNSSRPTGTFPTRQSDPRIGPLRTNENPDSYLLRRRDSNPDTADSALNILARTPIVQHRILARIFDRTTSNRVPLRIQDSTINRVRTLIFLRALPAYSRACQHQFAHTRKLHKNQSCEHHKSCRSPGTLHSPPCEQSDCCVSMLCVSDHYQRVTEDSFASTRRGTGFQRALYHLDYKSMILSYFLH